LISLLILRVSEPEDLPAHQKDVKIDQYQLRPEQTYDPEKRIIRRIQSGGCAIHCQDCGISQLCIPFTLNEHERSAG
jgi:hypothetical protein